MSIVLKVAAAVLVLLAVAGAVKAITDDDSDPNYRSVTVGNTEVLIPFYISGDELLPAAIKRYMAKLGYVTAYRRCVAAEVAKKISPAELEGGSEASATAFKEKTIDVMAQANPKCSEPGRPILDPNATPEQIARIRESLVAALPVELASLNLTPNQTACAAERVGQISDAEVLAAENGGPSRGEAIFATAMEPCFH